MKKTICFIMIFIVAETALLSGCATNIDKYFAGKRRGKTVRGYMRYGTYDVWDHFLKSEQYGFEIANKEKKGFLDIRVCLLPGTKKTLSAIVRKEISDETKKHKIVGDKYFKVLYQKKLTINDNNAILLKYQYDIYDKNEHDFYKYLETVEICYIAVENYIVKISSSGFEELIGPLRKKWQKFYLSFHNDHSRAYKTNFGSFDLIDNIRYDHARIRYSIPKTDYGIIINYIPDDEKEDHYKNITSPAWMIRMSSKFSGIKVKQVKKKTLVVDGKKAGYVEYLMIDTKKNKRSRSMYFIVNEFSPALEITAFAEEKLFELYRGEMEALLKSLKFNQ